MKIIEPIEMTDAKLSFASIAEDDAPLWDASTAYVLNDKVISLASHSVYVCEVGNTGIDPDTDIAATPNWTRLGATNRWKAFDLLISDPAISANTIVYTVTPDRLVSGIAMFGLVADKVTITVELGAAVLIYVIDLISYDDIDGFYSWLFSGVNKETEALRLDLPYLGAGTSYKVEISGVGSLQVGQIVLGEVVDLGVTPWGSEVGIQDYSRKDRDIYGNAKILERRFSRTASFQIGCDARRVRRVQRKMEQFRATPAVWIGDERAEYALVVFGFYTSYTHVLSHNNWSRAVIEVEGLV